MGLVTADSDGTLRKIRARFVQEVQTHGDEIYNTRTCEKPGAVDEFASLSNRGTKVRVPHTRAVKSQLSLITSTSSSSQEANCSSSSGFLETSSLHRLGSFQSQPSKFGAETWCFGSEQFAALPNKAIARTFRFHHRMVEQFTRPFWQKQIVARCIRFNFKTPRNVLRKSCRPEECSMESPVSSSRF